MTAFSRLALVPDYVMSEADNGFVSGLAVCVEGGTISHVCEVGSLPRGYEVTSLPGSTLLPGLIDSHVHLTFGCESTLTPGDFARSDRESERALARVVEELQNDTVEALFDKAKQAASRALRAGVTTVRDCGDRDFVTLRLRDAVDSGEIVGPRVIACGVPITTERGHCFWLGGGITDVSALPREVDLRADRGVDFIKIMVTGGGMTVGSSMLELQFTDRDVRAVVNCAHKRGLRVAAHSQCISGTQVCLNAGVDFVEHCGWLNESGFQYDASVAKAIVQSGVWIGITLNGALQSAALAGENSVPKWGRDRLNAMARLLQAGANMTLHSDAIAPVTPHDSFPLSLVAAIRHGGLSPFDAVTCATKAPATSMGLGEIGEISVGKRADLFVVDGHLPSDPVALLRPRMVFRDGMCLNITRSEEFLDAADD